MLVPLLLPLLLWASGCCSYWEASPFSLLSIHLTAAATVAAAAVLQGIVELIVSLTVAAAAWLLLLLSAATAVLSQQLLLQLDALFNEQQTKGLAASPVAAVLQALQQRLQQLVLLSPFAAEPAAAAEGSTAASQA